MPKAINIQRYLDAFHPDHTLSSFTLGEDMPAKKATGPRQVWDKPSKRTQSPNSTGKLAGAPDKGKRKPKVKRSTLQREQTMQAKSRSNAGFDRGKQAAIATLPSGEQIVLMIPAKRRRGSKYSGGLS
tara:strand:- start:497 stop:880 length:384 start_codon:yes stop_codon:yes gene_type:complete